MRNKKESACDSFISRKMCYDKVCALRSLYRPGIDLSQIYFKDYTKELHRNELYTISQNSPQYKQHA